MNVNPDVSAEHAGQRLELQVAFRRRRLFICRGVLRFAGLGCSAPDLRVLRLLFLVFGKVAAIGIPLLPVILGVGESLAIARHVAHARRRELAFFSVDAFGIFAARHLEPIGGARKLHRLIGHGMYVLQDHRTAADQIGRAGQYLQRGHAAFERGLESGVLRPHGVFRPDIGRDRTGRFIAVRKPAHAWTRVDAEVRMDVDDSRCDPSSVRVDPGRAGRCVETAADGRDAAIDDEQVRAVEALSGPGEDRRALNQQRRGGRRHVGGRIGFGREPRRYRGKAAQKGSETRMNAHRHSSP